MNCTALAGQMRVNTDREWKEQKGESIHTAHLAWHVGKPPPPEV